MGIDQQAVAMGVVVQIMVPSDISGVLFTANPTTGDRNELVFNASFGLEEAIIAGQVTPDTKILDKATLVPREIVLGAKQAMVIPLKQGPVTQPVPDAHREEQALPAPLLRELASLGVQVEQQFRAVPQDIEWAVADGHCWLLQARPITNLPPAPLHDVRWEPPTPGSRWIRRQVAENMPGPLSPLFDELYLGEGLDCLMEEIFVSMGIPREIGAMIERPTAMPTCGPTSTSTGPSFRRSCVPRPR
jgi:pyruvate,water dikinase